MIKGKVDKRRELIKGEVDILIVIAGDGVFILLTDYLLIDFTEID